MPSQNLADFLGFVLLGEKSGQLVGRLGVGLNLGLNRALIRRHTIDDIPLPRQEIDHIVEARVV